MRRRGAIQDSFTVTLVKTSVSLGLQSRAVQVLSLSSSQVLKQQRFMGGEKGVDVFDSVARRDKESVECGCDVHKDTSFEADLKRRVWLFPTGLNILNKDVHAAGVSEEWAGKRGVLGPSTRVKKEGRKHMETSTGDIAK